MPGKARPYQLEKAEKKSSKPKMKETKPEKKSKKVILPDPPKKGVEHKDNGYKGSFIKEPKEKKESIGNYIKRVNKEKGLI